MSSSKRFTFEVVIDTDDFSDEWTESLVTMSADKARKEVTDTFKAALEEANLLRTDEYNFWLKSFEEKFYN